MASINFNKIKFLESCGTENQLPISKLPEIAFVGKSNVGKSSLLNKLCNNKNLAKVSSTPGKTTTINFFDAANSILVDLPGYGFAKRSKDEKLRWSKLIEGYFNQNRNFALIILLLDIRHLPTKLDLDMFDYIHELSLPFMITLTKADKISKQQQNNSKIKILSQLNSDDRIPTIITSSEKNIGLTELRTRIENSF